MSNKIIFFLNNILFVDSEIGKLQRKNMTGWEGDRKHFV